MLRLSRWLKSVSEVAGSIVAWLTVPMVVLTFIIVVLRYAFNLGWIWMQESVVWMHAVVFMLASAYALKHDAHVRVDIFYRRMTMQRRAWVNLLGTFFFLVPTAVFLIWTSADYVAVSWNIREGSREAGGLPFPFVPVLKTMIPLAFALVIVQGVADAIDSLAVLMRATAGESGPAESSRNSE